jgi:hypothetical protein
VTSQDNDGAGYSVRKRVKCSFRVYTAAPYFK